MALYKYIAAAIGRETQEVVIEADNAGEALNKLRSSGLRPVRFCGETDVAAGAKSFMTRSKVDAYEFTEQLAPLLVANIPLERALGIITEACSNEHQRQFVTALRQGLHEGKKFSGLVRSYGPVFPGFYANLIETGEETGCLPEVVDELRRFMAESRELKEFIITSSVYPAVVLGLIIIVTILMFTVFVPKFAQIFVDMGREQPPSMVFLLFMSDLMLWSMLIPPLALIGWLVVKWRYGAARIKEWRSRMVLKIPVFGKLLVEIENGRFIQTLSILVANHVDIIRTVRIATKVIQNQIIRESFSNLERRLKGGEKLSAAISGNPFVPPGTAAKIRVGEESGYVGEMLKRVAEHLEENTRRKIKRMLSIFEPAMIVFLAVLVLIVVVSIFLAIMEINQVNA